MNLCLDGPRTKPWVPACMYLAEEESKPSQIRRARLLRQRYRVAGVRHVRK